MGRAPVELHLFGADSEHQCELDGVTEGKFEVQDGGKKLEEHHETGERVPFLPQLG